ncbi:MAG: hypothetical protein DVS81_05415 [Candidatus Accumulibacter meliphilus]|uniref:Uncharacterized protein n=1 Tax=Candidatus Accumulibacter meliphilus TaxID=2211374 RepID=A0A369XRY8_9PROT|nr:MAG: hypothetical protein DVS81_05415 [Candidatus Accumulibacter meliphilus]
MVTSSFLVADHYGVSHIPAATILGSRLNSILARMHQGRSLTKYALDFLREQDLPGLFRLASGEITHEAYVAALDADFLKENLAAKAVHQAREAEAQALEAHYLARRPKYVAAKTASKAEWEAEPERTLRRQRERQASEAVLKAQRARQAEWKAQRECNSRLASVAYQARAMSPDYTAPTADEVARHFHLSHVAGVLCPPMSEILEALFEGRPLSDDEFSQLKNKAPDDLYRLASGQLRFDAYSGRAKAAAAEVAAEAARIARESDPEYIAMMQQQSLYRKYGLSLTDKSLMPRMTKLLHLIDAGKHLPQDELVWLGTEAKEFFTKPIREAYHLLEAEFHADRYRSSGDPWNVINASGHYRKCRRAETALELLESLARDRLKQPKLRSAVLTTHGGVMRDLNRRPEAIQMAETAHSLMPRDYRPCTLLGAVHMEQREFERGRAWYEKARERGAPEESIDSELRSIYHRLDADARKAMKRFLLAESPHRYAWLDPTRKE